MSDIPSPDPFEFFRKLWSPMGAVVPGFAPGMMFPTTNVAEIEKRISELKSVQTWLSLNLETVRTMIQGLEAQKATISAFQSMNAAAASAATSAANAATAAAVDAARPRVPRKKKGP
jgi:hypothetical protein